MRPYVIWSPSYTNFHGGIRALHVLHKELQQRGLETYLHYESSPEGFTIYPEIMPGNPLNAPVYAHWLLNKGQHDGMCFAWETGMGDYPLLTVDIIEPFWYDRGLQRTGVGYWQGKGHACCPDGATEITRANFPDRTELATFVAGLDYLVSSDPFTAVNVEAVISGTPVVIQHNNNQWSRDEIEAHGWTPYGIAWGFDELDKAREEVHLAAKHYANLRQVFQGRIDAFIETTCDL